MVTLDRAAAAAAALSHPQTLFWSRRGKRLQSSLTQPPHKFCVARMLFCLHGPAKAHQAAVVVQAGAAGIPLVK